MIFFLPLIMKDDHNNKDILNIDNNNESNNNIFNNNNRKKIKLCKYFYFVFNFMLLFVL